MSILDITLGTRVYSLSSAAGSSVVRKCTKASLPAHLMSSTLEISHTSGSGNKPDRHLIKVVDKVADSTTGDQRDYLGYTVVQVPKKGSVTEVDTVIGSGSGDNALAATLGDIQDNSDLILRIVNGEFS